MKKTYTTQTSLWAGTEESMQQFNALAEKWEAVTPAEAGIVMKQGCSTCEGDDDDEEEPPRLLSVSDGVGLITVHGALTNEDKWWNAYAGLTYYGDIQKAVFAAVADPNVREILYDVHSPGGMVSGAQDTMSMIANAAKVKRSTMYSSLVASAAYWIMAGVKERAVAATAMVGSIGVLLRHVEFSKAAEMAGVTETVIRAGKYKQLANSAEPLTDMAKKELQAQAEHIYQVFVQDVADGLKISYQQADAMAQGREFIGSQAVDAGLVDKVESFDEVYASIVKRNQRGGSTPMKKNYSMAAALAAAATGVGAPEALASPADEEVVSEGAPAPEASAKAPDSIPEAAPDAVAAVDSEVIKLTAQVDLLKAQIAEKDEALFAAKTEAKAYASMPKMKAIVAQTVSNMQVALGGVVDTNLESMASEDLVARHEAVLAQFVEKFKVGGVSASATDTAPKPKATVTRLDVARGKAVKTRP